MLIFLNWSKVVSVQHRIVCPLDADSVIPRWSPKRLTSSSIHSFLIYPFSPYARLLPYTVGYTIQQNDHFEATKYRAYVAELTVVETALLNVSATRLVAVVRFCKLMVHVSITRASVTRWTSKA